MQINDVKAVVTDFVGAVRDVTAQIRDDEAKIAVSTAAHEKRKSELAGILREAAANVRRVLRT